MRLPAGFEWGMPRTEAFTYCIRRIDARETLCGRRIDRAPIFQPEDPKACVECVGRVASRKPVVEAALYGVCPVCGGEVPLAGDVVAPHPEWVVRADGPCVGSRQCDGRGEKPEVTG